MLDTQVIMDYLAVIVNSDNTRLSQLRNAYYKVRGGIRATDSRRAAQFRVDPVPNS